MEDLEARIRGRLVESGGHRVWTGARRGDGIGVVKVGGRTVTVGRAVWELARSGRAHACWRVDTRGGRNTCPRGCEVPCGQSPRHESPSRCSRF